MITLIIMIRLLMSMILRVTELEINLLEIENMVLHRKLLAIITLTDLTK